MQALDIIQHHIEDLSETSSSLFQVDVAPLALAMLRDVLGRDWDALERGGETAIDLGRTFVDSAHQKGTMQRQKLLHRFREFQAARLDTFELADFADVPEFTDVAENLSSGIKGFLGNFKTARADYDRAFRDDFDRDLALSLCVHGLKAKSFASFNTLFQQSNNKDGSLIVDQLQGSVKRFEVSVRCDQLGIYDALVRGQKGPSLREDIRRICNSLESAIPQFYRSLAPGVAVYLHNLDQGNVGKTESVARTLLAANDTWREAVSSYIALQALRFHLLEFKRVDGVRNLVDKAAALAFDVELPNGKNTSIGDVGSLENDKFVELWGVTSAVDQRVLSDDSLASQLTLETISGTASVECAVRFAHLNRMGIGPGTYLRINGYKRDYVTILDGDQGVTIDRLSHAELANMSWRYALLRLSNRYFPRWRHNLNISWSPMPHLPPSDWENGSISGANEFIYSPFLR